MEIDDENEIYEFICCCKDKNLDRDMIQCKECKGIINFEFIF